MHIEKLSLINFKNYEEVTLNFSKKVNCFLGKNGSGKTNLLDAIYYLSATKSAFNPSDSQNIKFDERFFAVEGNFLSLDREYKVKCALKEGAKKIIKVNGAEYDKLREHVGKFPVIFITPNDTDLIREGSEVRRKFLDQIISQTDRNYLDALIEYNHFLKQRNSLLKRFSETNTFDKVLIEPYDLKILSVGLVINKKRSEFIKQFKDDFLSQFYKISGANEQVDIEYQSDFSQNGFDKTFKAQLKKDMVLQRTTMGVHKDDFKFFIGKKPLKKFGSQGQQKSFVIGLKLAHYFTLLAHNGFQPILLLDDIFDKLDSERISLLVQMITNDELGQVFITDARLDRSKELLNASGIEGKFYEIRNGSVQDA